MSDISRLVTAIDVPLANLDDRIKNPDQYAPFLAEQTFELMQLVRMITHDIQRFSNHLSTMYSNLLKPVLDVIVCFVAPSTKPSRSTLLADIQLPAVAKRRGRRHDWPNRHGAAYGGAASLLDAILWLLCCT